MTPTNQLLSKLGLDIRADIPVSRLFDQKFNGEVYGLSEEDSKRVRVIREIITEYNRSIPVKNVEPITKASAAAELMRHTLKGLDHEECWVLYLDRANKPIEKKLSTKGVLDQTPFNISEIVRNALLLSASGIIIYHNHPSGKPTPSTCDVRQTDQLRKACDLFSITLLDHIIICDDSYYSFADEEEAKFC